MSIRAIPEGYHAVTPYMVVSDGAAFIKFVKAAFGATVNVALELPGGKIGHAEVTIDDSKIMISDGNDQCKAAPVTLYLYVQDCDEVYKKAVAAGGQSTMEPTDMFYGDRHGGVTDPCGNTWWIATHKEDVPHEELESRKKVWMEKYQQNQKG